MNPAVQKYVPPILVLGAALYWGWPPSQPIDLGDDLVKARAVRWSASDLESPSKPSAVVDPFRPVLVAGNETSEAEQVEVVPSGPTEADIRAAVKLTGIAKIGGRSWAIINGKPQLVGDTVATKDKLVKSCKLLAVHPDHILVESEKTIVVIRPQVSRGSTMNSSVSAAGTEVKQTIQNAPPPDMGPPARNSI